MIGPSGVNLRSEPLIVADKPRLVRTSSVTEAPPRLVF